MKIDSLEKIWSNLGYIIQIHNNYNKKILSTDKLVYNCNPIITRGGEAKNTFIEVGYLYLISRVKDDSQGFIYFECIDRINYNDENKIYIENVDNAVIDKLFKRHNINIAQIYNAEAQKFLNRKPVEWKLSEYQKLYTTREEAEAYIRRCKKRK